MNSTPVVVNVTGSEDYRSTSNILQGVFMICISVTIVCSVNATMLYTFSKHQDLRQNPRYVLFIHLVLNDMIQLSSSIFLYTLAFALCTVFTSFCVFLLLPAILASTNTPLNLACMATECYISVCFPLRYNNICTLKRTYIVIGVMWTISWLNILPDVFLIFITEELKFLNARVFCERDTVFRNSYSLSKRNATHIFFLVVVFLTLFYTYFRILFAASSAKADTTKARKTILLHGFQVMLCMTVYVQPLVNQLFTLLFPKEKLLIQRISFVIVQVVPRFLSPIVYGLRDNTFRKYFKKSCICLHITATHTVKP